MSKIVKKEDAKKVEVKAETKVAEAAVAVAPKKLTPIKKAAEAAPVENKAEAVLKDETKSPAEAAKEIIAMAEKPKAERPSMPAGFCMEPKDWEGSGVCYDPTASICNDETGACKKDFPECHTACKARAEFLGTTAKAGKTARAKKSGEKATRTPKNGKAPQSDRINELLMQSTPLVDIVAEIARADYGGETEAGKKAADARINRHLKSIKDNTYVKAAIMLPHITYLAAVKAAEAAAPAKA